MICPTFFTRSLESVAVDVTTTLFESHGDLSQHGETSNAKATEVNMPRPWVLPDPGLADAGKGHEGLLSNNNGRWVTKRANDLRRQ